MSESSPTSKAPAAQSSDPSLEENEGKIEMTKQELRELLIRCASQDFQGMDLSGAMFRRGTIISLANFSGAKLHNVKFEWGNNNQLSTDGVSPGSDLNRVNFSNADLTGAEFTKANLSGANFNGANLTNARFSSAQLRGADLSNAIVTGADLSATGLSKEQIADLKARGAVNVGQYFY